MVSLGKDFFVYQKFSKAKKGLRVLVDLFSYPTDTKLESIRDGSKDSTINCIP